MKGGSRVGVPRAALVVALVAIVAFAVVVVASYEPGRTSTVTTATATTTATTTTTTTATSGFSDGAALGFYEGLNTPLGLLADHPGSNTVWLADDQALDYYALLDVYDSTGNAAALSLANQLNKSIAGWGGLLGYWNPAFEAFGSFPDNTTVMCGINHGINVTDGYAINATEFKACPGFDYSLFADLLAYRVLLEVHFGNFTGAESDFRTLNGMWDGYGFRDQPFNQTHMYQSYKLADYVLAWKSLADEPATAQFAQGCLPTLQGVEAVMSRLQAPTGGVWTGYEASKGQVIFGDEISLTNGETTSLFVLAD